MVRICTLADSLQCGKRKRDLTEHKTKTVCIVERFLYTSNVIILTIKLKVNSGLKSSSSVGLKNPIITRNTAFCSMIAFRGIFERK